MDSLRIEKQKKREALADGELGRKLNILENNIKDNGDWIIRDNMGLEEEEEEKTKDISVKSVETNNDGQTARYHNNFLLRSILFSYNSS